MMRFLLLILMMMVFVHPAKADTLPVEDFKNIPVQHNGRIKPIDSFARLYLKSFSGQENLRGMSHNEWFAEALFNPPGSFRRPVFRIFRPALLNLPPKKDRLYSYAELAPALQQIAPSLIKLRETDEKDWSEDQQELARLQDYAILYTQILRSFSLILPLANIPPEIAMDIPALKKQKTITLKEVSAYQKTIDIKVQNLLRKKGEDIEQYSEAEKELVQFAFATQTLQSGGENNVLFRVIPSEGQGEWKSPWTLSQHAQSASEPSKAMQLWEDAAEAYLFGNQEEWKKATSALRKYGAKETHAYSLSWEIAYNQIHPLQWAMMLYLAAFLCFCLYSGNDKPLFYKASLITLLAGMGFNGFAILARILILHRPPVGTLYESILFVSLICAGLALALEYKRKDGNGLLIGSVAGGLLLFIAEGFAEDDSLRMLVAVLNTNFWLGTHVLCITIGYALCLITSGYAHLYLMRKAYQPEDIDTLGSTIKTMMLLSLLFTAIGTILGGIWADQSWGRFWGWDPKENGALLIVLWLIWVLHGQISGHIKRVPAMVLSALLSVVVALAWFGVNLLNIGLHSYGFISGVAGGLIAFCVAEFLLIGFLWHKIHAKEAIV